MHGNICRNGIFASLFFPFPWFTAPFPSMRRPPARLWCSSASASTPPWSGAGSPGCGHPPPTVYPRTCEKRKNVGNCKLHFFFYSFSGTFWSIIRMSLIFVFWCLSHLIFASFAAGESGTTKSTWMGSQTPLLLPHPPSALCPLPFPASPAPPTMEKPQLARSRRCRMTVFGYCRLREGQNRNQVRTKN